jgi:chromosome segregation protein
MYYMATLERISIQGFKSFKRQISIPFPPGFSVVTGPNGCGKSNLSDAISFVIGKTSSRVLRAKKAQELVFHGSKDKPGAEYAKVTLFFDNSSGGLPFQDKSVTLSRRINQKGVSSYRLNGKLVTRQEILDTFNQAGIHAGGHNIIKQGDVNQVVEMDAIERRQIIDEISGILEYDEKKAKAETELQAIADKVREAELILQEKQNIVDKLRKERDTAVRYKELEQALERIRASILWKDYHSSERGLADISNKLAEKEKEMAELEAAIQSLDGRIAGGEKDMEDLTKSVVQASGQIEVSRRLARVRSELEIKKDRIESKRREIERLNLLVERLGAVERRESPAAVRAVLGMRGVSGMFSSLVRVPAQYGTAFEVAAGGHLNDVVVDALSSAVACVNYLKRNRIGRVRFLPLDRVEGYPRKALPAGAIGWMSDLVKHNPEHGPAVAFVLGTTALVRDIEAARSIAQSVRVRLVTLDGDLVEASGAVTGGFYKRSRDSGPDATAYLKERKGLEDEIGALEADVSALNRELEILASKEQGTKTINLERDRVRIDESLKRGREERREAYERKLVVQQDIGRLNIQKARLEAKFDNLKVMWDESKGKKDWTGGKRGVKEDGRGPEALKPYVGLEISTLKDKERDAVIEIESLGPVNMKAVDDFESIRVEFEDFRSKVDRIASEKKSIEEAIAQIEEKRKGTFMKAMTEVSRNFKDVYRELTGGEAELGLEGGDSIDSGMVIKAQPPGKKLLNIDSLSGGEKTLTAFAFLFAIQRHKPSPFYILDEADASLDKVNTQRVAGLIRKQSKLAQFIVITHNEALVREADRVYGISMDQGESKVMAIELPRRAAEPAGKAVAEAREPSKNN